MKKLLLAFAFLLALPSTALAQLGSVPFTFSPGTTILSAEVNSNFSTVYTNALNRTGGTMTGTLTAQSILAAANNTYDIGATGTKFRDGFFAGTLTAGTFTGSGTGLTGVALLASANVFTLAQTFNSTTTGNKSITLGGSPADNSAAFINLLSSNTQKNWRIGQNAAIAGALEFTPSTAAGGSTFTTPVLTITSAGVYDFNGKWGINAAGDWTFGASAHVTDSAGTPAISACGTSPVIAGKDYSFTFVTGSTNTTSCTVTLSQSASWVCTGNFGTTVPGPMAISLSGAVATITYASTNTQVGYVHCRGF